MNKPIQHVLLIDDNVIDNFSHERTLRKSGLVETISVCQYASEALEQLRNNSQPVDIIFLDIYMPRMNGFEFLAEYADIPDSCKARVLVMMLSSYNFSKTEQTLIADLVTKCVPKPLTIETIEQLAKEHFPSATAEEA